MNMTIRETITNTLRALVEIPAVVEMAREANEMRRTHIETALRLQLAKKQAHIDMLQSRARKNSETITRALRENSDLIARLAMANKRVGEAADRNNELQNELGPAKALIAVKNRMIGALSARIRELEEHITEVEAVRDSLADVINGEKKTTIADLWEPIGGSEWLAVCSSSDRILFGGGIRWPSICRPIERGDDRTHYILLEPPR
jgi:chromosome segregation ATPase